MTLRHFVIPSIVICAASTLDLGLVSDDYVHLVENVGLPLTASTDPYMRPLRNICFKSLASIFGVHPLPYHILMAGLYIAVVCLLYYLARGFKFSQTAAVTTAVLFALYPRNHQALYWFSASQDIVVALCLLTSAIAWLAFREKQKRLWMALSLIAFTVSLGFKESAAAFMVIPFIIDWYILRRRFYASLAFIGVTVVYVPIVAMNASPQFISAQGVVKSFGFATINAAAPFFGVQAWHTVLMWLPFLLLSLVVVYFALRSSYQKIAVFGLLWFSLFLIPASSIGYTDRYLFVPVIGGALLVGAASEQIRRVLPAALVIYCLASGVRFYIYHQQWALAAHEVAETAERAKSGESPLLIEHSRCEGQVYVLNNGAAGLLKSNGVSSQPPFVFKNPAN